MVGSVIEFSQGELKRDAKVAVESVVGGANPRTMNGSFF